MFGEEEKFFQCPYCFERISFLLETSYGDQSYIEDCEVCCQPIEVAYTVDEGQVLSLEAKRAQ